MARTALTEEEKKARAEARKTAKSADNTGVKEESVADNRDKEIEDLKANNEALANQIKALMAKLESVQTPQIIQVSADVEKVHLLWQAEVSDDNIQFFGENGRFGRVTGKTGDFYMTKTDFSTIIDERIRYFLEKRWLIVLDGLNDDEREAYGVAYKDGEYLDKIAFRKIVEMGDKILDLFPHLCEGNKFMVAQRYLEAYAKGSPLVKRETVVRLNEMSKSKKNPKGYFMPIIRAMNDLDEDGEE